MIHFLTEQAVIEVHEDQIRDFGGSHSLRDASLLDSALNQPKWAYHLHNANLFEIAAAYGFHICKNHPFVDGNKQTALICIALFLEYNGFTIIASDGEILDKY